MHGIGMYTRNTWIIAGEWRNGKLNGYGRAGYGDGTGYYVGMFKDMGKHGEGKEVLYENGIPSKTIIGRWEKDKYVKDEKPEEN